MLYTQEASIHEQATQLLQQYLQINTTNPPGQEMQAAVFFKKICEQEGIEFQIFDLGEGRANFLGILRGNGTQKPIILLHHSDVVPAEPSYWKVDPFSGAIINGEIYGRGAVDIKGKGIIDLAAIIQLKRSKFPLTRDILFLAVADEEENSLGTRWMVTHHPEIIQNAEFLIDEGECIVVHDAARTPLHYMVSIGEKAPLWLTLTFTGQPGHGSIPMQDSAVNQAIRAAYKIISYETPLQLNPILHAYVGMLLESQDITKIPGYTQDLSTSLQNPAFLQAIGQNPEINAAIRNTISLTCLKGSDKTNTIPNQASMSIDCRLLPGQDKDEFIRNLQNLIQNPTMQITVEEYSPATCSSWDNAFSRALAKCAQKRNPAATVIPTILLSSTDSTFYRPLGIQAYGFEPYCLNFDERNLAHSNDERIQVSNIAFGIDLLVDLLKELNQ